MQKTLTQTPDKKVLLKHNPESAKKRLAKLNFYLSQIGKSMNAEGISFYK